MKAQDNVRQKKTGGKKCLIIIVIAVFALGFLFGAYKTLSILREDKNSETAYDDLRGQLTAKTAPQPSVSGMSTEDRTETEETEAAVVEMQEPQAETATPQTVISDISVEESAETEDVEAAVSETQEPQVEAAAPQPSVSDISNEDSAEAEDTEAAADETQEPQVEAAAPQPSVSDMSIDDGAETEETEAAVTETAAEEVQEPPVETAAPQTVISDISVEESAETEDAIATGTADCSAKRQQSMDMSSLKEAYPQMQAWIEAEGTKIDYPVMQAADNNYYLSHLYDGKSNANGSIFMDYRNSGVFTDDNTVFYGHNMKNGSMFHVLMEYKAQDFYEAHPTMMIYTEEGDYLVELICGTVENGDYEFVEFNFDDFDEMNGYVDKLKKKSTFESEVVLLPGDKLISMCTCTYERDNARYMLLGKVTALYE